ncbi:3-oxoadipate enol-lactonase [Sphingomonas colocasiae]|uniref:3-oxoadipate enol-lactonase n=1 Tax=Sphingomonas colocasiae TaxID=1848973 RepID=A0ABS7PZG4_9SPHN|nr:3-oxoadipate enol-lactonase [Sphingomonas colocasiae]MBY8825722.1 3-oxoadipate enol-lactonase [Sphingomonas colocasiae]
MTEGIAPMSDSCPIAWRIDGPGDAPILLLSNSLGTTTDMWAPQLAALTARHRVLRYDSRGHGRSGAPAGDYTLDRLGLDAVELLDSLGIAAVDVCGLSLGGMVGQWLGVHQPERIGRLIIANSSAYMGPPSAWHDRIALVRAHGMAAIADAVTERWFTPEFRATSPDAVDTIRSMLLTTAPDGYCGACAAIAAMDMRPLLPRIARPVLVIGGLRDPATPPDHARALAAGIAGSQLVELPAAHLSNVELPECFTEAVTGFLA